MAGDIIDVSREPVIFPGRIILDSNLVIIKYFSTFHTPHPSSVERANQCFDALVSSNSIGFITSTGLQEIFHFAIRARYQAELPAYRAELMRLHPNQRRFDWLDLYKARSDILRNFGASLERLRHLLIFNGLVFLQFEDLAPFSEDRRLDEELLASVGRYGLDTNDAAMLLEVRRAGIMSIATLDRDIRRAAVDFDVYTWAS